MAYFQKIYVVQFVSCTVMVLAVLNVSFVSCQRLCTISKKEIPSNNVIFMESFSATKCMKMEGLGILPDSKVLLGECLYRTKSSRDQQFQSILNPLNRTTFRHDAGRGEHYCLTTSSRDELKNTLCNMKNLDQSWTLKPVQGQPGEFLIEQFSTKKCLKPKSRAARSTIQLATCNAYETEQIWKILYLNPASNLTTVTPC